MTFCSVDIPKILGGFPFGFPFKPQKRGCPQKTTHPYVSPKQMPPIGGMLGSAPPFISTPKRPGWQSGGRLVSLPFQIQSQHTKPLPHTLPAINMAPDRGPLQEEIDLPGTPQVPPHQSHVSGRKVANQKPPNPILGGFEGYQLGSMWNEPMRTVLDTDEAIRS